MANLSRLEFTALDITGSNYNTWALDAEIHLDARALGETIKKENQASNQEKAKAMIFLRHHLHEALKMEYLTVKDPSQLWNDLKERYDHLKLTVLPQANFDWINLRFQDYKTVSEYNSALFRITSQLKLCGSEVTDAMMLEKTFTTFHASNVVLQQQYRQKGFTKYSELISLLLVAEQQNILLMKNHETRPTGSAPLPEVNIIGAPEKSEKRQNNYRGRGHGRGRGYGRGRGRKNNRHGINKFEKNHHHGVNKFEKFKNSRNTTSTSRESNCHRCGLKGHWAHICRAPEHFARLYQASLKRKETDMEAHLTDHINDAGANMTIHDDELNVVHANNYSNGPTNDALTYDDFFNDNN